MNPIVSNAFNSTPSAFNVPPVFNSNGNQYPVYGNSFANNVPPSNPYLYGNTNPVFAHPVPSAPSYNYANAEGASQYAPVMNPFYANATPVANDQFAPSAPPFVRLA